MRGSASRRDFDPSQNGIAAYRFMLTSAHLCCEENVGNDNLYAAHVTRLRRLAQPSISRHWKAWLRLRDGCFVDDAGQPIESTGDPPPGARWEPGFWTGHDGKPLSPGTQVPKEAYTAMEGAVHQILHLDGMYWIKPKRASKMLDAYRSKMGASDEEWRSFDADEEEEEP